MKIEKIEVKAKTRQLKATYTLDEDNQFGEELEKLLQEEIDKEILINLKRSQGWHEVLAKQFSKIDKEWCKKYIKKPYVCVGQYNWFFEDERDAHFFLLKWGSNA
jgi:uncharacterized membrane protein YheB (UPF0754 family)